MTQLPVDSFWARVRSEIGGHAKDWAVYRLDVGKFYYRSFNPADPVAKDFLKVAMEEFEAVERLDPGNAEAAALSSRLRENLNIFGDPNDLDLRPDFDRFAIAYSQSIALARPLFDLALEILLNTGSALTPLRDLVRRQADGFDRQAEEARIEVERAAVQVDAAAEAERLAQERVSRIQKQINTLENRLRLGLFTTGDGEVLGSLFEVATLIGSLVGPIGAIAGVPGLVVQAVGNFQDQQRVADSVNWFEQVGQDLGDLGGGLKDAYEQTTGLVNEVLFKADIAKARIEVELKGLLAQAADLNFELAAKRAVRRQADLARAAASARATNARADAVLARRQADVLLDGIRQQVATARTLIRRAQSLIDTATHFLFWTARSLDIYSVAQSPTALELNCAHPHPDDEERAYRAVLRGEPNAAGRLISLYLEPLSQIPQLAALQEKFLGHDNRLQDDLVFFRFNSPELLQRFATGAEVELHAPIDGFPTNQRLAIVDKVYVILAGARASTPLIDCTLEHLGRAEVRLEGGQVVTRASTPLRVPADAFKSASDFQREPPGSRPRSFFGRSPAARWRLALEPNRPTGIDLSGLTEIQLGLDVRYLPG